MHWILDSHGIWITCNLLISGDKWKTRRGWTYNQYKAILGPNKVDKLYLSEGDCCLIHRHKRPHSSVTLNLFSNECCLPCGSFLSLFSPCSNFRVVIHNSRKGDVSLASFNKGGVWGVDTRYGYKCLTLVLYPLSSMLGRKYNDFALLHSYQIR